LIPKATAVTCDRYGQDRIVSETHFKRGDDIIARMRHDRCGGRAGEVELLTGIKIAPTSR